MTATLAPHDQDEQGAGLPALDVSDTERTPFWRQVGVEARKMVDTRSGFWLLLITGILLVLTGVITLLVTLLNDFQLSAGTLTQIMVVPLSLLLPVFAITTVTSEWSQRTGLVTFTQEPHRMRIMAAKLVTVVLLALGTIAVAVVVGVLTNLLFGALGDTSADWRVDGGVFLWTLVNQLLYFLMAFGFGMLLLSTPGAIAVYYVVALLLPFMVYGPVFAIFAWGQDVIPWVDLGFAIAPLATPEGEMGMDGTLNEGATATVYAQVAVTTLIWVVLPLALGSTRVARAEIK